MISDPSLISTTATATSTTTPMTSTPMTTTPVTTTPVSNGTVCDWTTIATWACCTALYPCELGEGDCDNDGECVGSLVCGTDNCGGIFASSADCCISSTCKELKNR